MSLECGLVLRSTTKERHWALALSFQLWFLFGRFILLSFFPWTFLSVSLYLLSGKNGQLSTPISSMRLKETNAEAT